MAEKFLKLVVKLPIPPRKTLPSLPTQLYIFVFQTHQIQFMLLIYFWMCGLPLATSKLPRDMLSKHSSISFSCRYPSQPILDWGWDFTPWYTGIQSGLRSYRLIYSLITAVNFYVQLACCVLEILFPGSHLLALLQSFYLLLCNDS